MARNHQITTHKSTPIQRRQPRSPGLDWTCSCCGSLLGRIHGQDVHVRFERRHEYVASLPAAATCKKCGTLNRAKASTAA
ncbi:hypothetical protein [Meridianimarinicoccus sp. MJW13]|uniref:hypothetical protein n=1 Tax=Meridianimarinicoccus sp. MJW13 TaxID=2720031 RepID=UPI0018696D0A|nr:hypothetical protein [Fluviibacterium sp. MJW13]